MLSQSIQKLKSMGIYGGLFSLAVSITALTACGAPATGIAGPSANNSSLPPEVTSKAELFDVGQLSAVERKSPFRSLLMPEKPEGPAPGEAPPPPPTPPPDPFEGLNVVGIITKNNQSMAILKGTSSGPSQVVKLGQEFPHSTPSVTSVLKVQKISKGSISLIALGQPPEVNKKDLVVVSLVGYKNNAPGAPKAPTEEDLLKKEYLIKDPDTLEIPREITDIIKKNLLPGLGVGGKVPPELKNMTAPYQMESSNQPAAPLATLQTMPLQAYTNR